MFQPPPGTSNHIQHSVHPTPLSIQGSSALVPMDLNANSVNAQDDVQNEGFRQAESFIRNSQKLQDDLHALGMKIKQHEDNLNLLNTRRSKLDDSILNLQVTIGKFVSSSTPKPGNGDNPNPTSDEEVNKQILQHEKSAASVLCQLRTHHGTQASNLPLIKDVVGVVATLGKIEDDNLSRLFSDFLGVETMLAIVCRTYEGVKALETYDSGGCINKSSGLHGLGASIGKALNGRFLVICLESLRVDVHVKFPKQGISIGLDNQIENETQMKDMKSKKEKILEELKRERILLDVAKFNFNKKKNEFLRFLAQSSSYATQAQSTPDRYISR